MLILFRVEIILNQYVKNFFFLIFLLFTFAFLSCNKIDETISNLDCELLINSNFPTRIERTNTFDAFGFITKTKEGNILSFYREGYTHANDLGVIAMRKSSDKGNTWSNSKIIFEDKTSDLRDVKGGVLPSGKVVIFWRRINFSTLKFSVYFATSNDEGDTWSIPKLIPDAEVIYGSLINYNNNMAMLIGKINGPEAEGYIELSLYISSDDENNWIKSHNVSDSGNFNLLPTEEVTMISLNNNSLIGIGRNLKKKNLLLFYSKDLGETWTISETNIGPSISESPLWWLISPHLIKISSTKIDLWYGERMYEIKDGRVQQVGGRLYSIIINTDDIIENPTSFKKPKTLFSIDINVDMGYPSTLLLENNKFIGQFYSNTPLGLPDLFTISGEYYEDCID